MFFCISWSVHLITFSGTVKFLPILESSSSPKSIGNQVYLSIKHTSSNGILTETRRLRQIPSLDVAGLPLCSALLSERYLKITLVIFCIQKLNIIGNKIRLNIVLKIVTKNNFFHNQSNFECYLRRPWAETKKLKINTRYRLIIISYNLIRKLLPQMIHIVFNMRLTYAYEEEDRTQIFLSYIFWVWNV